MILSDPGQHPPPATHDYGFICGLHRSGTTLIARSLARHPLISGFHGTGTIEDEGQYLQTVLPLETAFGGVGRFGFDPNAHMTEESTFNTAANAARITSEWSRYWDLSKPVLIEKTPGNLLRMRLLQGLFRPSRFVIVVRHPVAAALATLKWTEGNLFSLLSHWVACYRLARADAAQLDCCLWLSYEAFVAEPQSQLDRLCRFLDLPAHDGWGVEARNDNAKYFDLWRTRFLPETGRAIAQKPAESRHGLWERARNAWGRRAEERSRPAHRRRNGLRDFHDAQDAAALLEPAIAEFGYSFHDLSRFPAF